LGGRLKKKGFFTFVGCPCDNLVEGGAGAREGRKRGRGAGGRRGKGEVIGFFS